MDEEVYASPFVDYLVTYRRDPATGGRKFGSTSVRSNRSPLEIAVNVARREGIGKVIGVYALTDENNLLDGPVSLQAIVDDYYARLAAPAADQHE